ncbi:MAG: D-alanyl-D-alanine carboxypeptidase family protein [Verrucomicrobia bacterium]|nr:D-alanyl-D-alanine carboxypeptidase family protein [Verrucomicrobiota bacterium]
MSTLQSDYVSRIDELLRELGIPSNYAELRELSIQPEPEVTELVSIGNNPEGNACQLTRPAARAWHSMYAAARNLEIELLPLSGFRSVERQAKIIRGKLDLGEKITDILHSIAAPGYSEHHTGCAIDIGSNEGPPLEEAFADTRAFAWLIRHGEEFGFKLSFPKHNPHGIVYEPWHWCWHK